MTRLRDAVELLAAGVLATLVVVVLVQVVARYVLRIPLSWSEESARYLLVWSTMLGAAAATARGQHIVIDTLSAFLRPRPRLILATLASIASVIALVVLIWASLPLLGTAGNTTSPGSGLEVRWVRLAIPVGAGLALIFFVASIRDLRRSRDDGDSPPGPTHPDGV